MSYRLLDVSETGYQLDRMCYLYVSVHATGLLDDSTQLRKAMRAQQADDATDKPDDEGKTN